MSVLILGSYHNTAAKIIMYDEVDRQSVLPLLTRIVSGNFGIFVGLTSVKFFPLTVISMVMNCAPLVSICLVGQLLGEIVTVAQVVSIIVALFGISLMLLGGKDSEKRP